jgi:cytochrome P450
MSNRTAVAFDPFTVYAMSDPYPLYRQLRDEAPVHRVEDADLWVVSRYDDCLDVLRDSSTYSSKLGMRLLFGGDGRRSATGQRRDDPFEEMGDLRVLIAIDPPDHVRLRRLLSRPFTPREIARHEGWMRPLCEERFSHLLATNDQGSADWVRDFTWPFPVLVIGELMGIPPSMRDEFKRWSDDLLGTFVGEPQLDELQANSLVEMIAFFGETIDRRRAEPGDDLIGTLIHKADADDEPLTADELVMFCVLLLVAGNETTTNLLSNMAKALHCEPDVLSHLRSDPTLIPGAVEEGLRYDSPVQAIPRGTTRPIEVDGHTIPEGATVLVYMGSANRDERQFPEPDRFDLHRNPTDHVGFGSGIHLCLGAALARLEARLALECMCRRVTRLELTAAPVPTGGLLLRGSESMPVHLETQA